MMDAAFVGRGLLAGLLATGAMVVVELLARSRWGPEILLDWEQNQAVAARILRRPAAAVVGAGLALHFLHGLVAGGLFALVLPVLSTVAPGWVLGLGYGFVLFALTLIAHGPTTGRRPSEAGLGAIGLAFVTHLVYGTVLAALLVWP